MGNCTKLQKPPPKRNKRYDMTFLIGEKQPGKTVLTNRNLLWEIIRYDPKAFFQLEAIN